MFLTHLTEAQSRIADIHLICTTNTQNIPQRQVHREPFFKPRAPAAADPGGGGGMPPPVPVKTSHKKDGRHSWCLVFHVSCQPPPPPPDHPGSDAVQNYLLVAKIVPALFGPLWVKKYDFSVGNLLSVSNIWQVFKHCASGAADKINLNALLALWRQQLCTVVLLVLHLLTYRWPAGCQPSTSRGEVGIWAF